MAPPRSMAEATEAWKAPELPVVLFLGIILVLTLLPLKHALRDLDVGWLIRYGEIIWETGRLPEADIFSFTQNGRSWTLYQWGFELYCGGLHRLAGLGGVIWGTALLVALTYSLLLYFLLSLRLHRLWCIGLTILALMAGSHYWYGRPGTANFLFYLLVLALLEGYRQAPRRQIWALPPLFVLWANVHIGFVVGLMAVLLYGLWAGLAPGAWRAGATRRDFRILAIFPLCVAALCLNPHGPYLLAYVKGATSSTFLNDNILELQSPNFHNAALSLFIGQLVLLLWLSIGNFPARSLFMALLTITLAMALYSGRHITFFSLTATVVLAHMLRDCWGLKADAPLDKPGQGWGWGMLGGALALIWVIAVPSWTPGYYDFDPKQVPRGVATFLESQSPKAPPLRVFSQDSQWASYLIYQLYPNAEVFIDSRYEFYGEDFIRKSWDLLDKAMQNPQVLNPWKVDFLIFRKDKLPFRPEAKADWVPVYEDSQALIFRHLPEGKAAPPERGEGTP